MMIKLRKPSKEELKKYVSASTQRVEEKRPKINYQKSADIESRSGFSHKSPSNFNSNFYGRFEKDLFTPKDTNEMQECMTPADTQEQSYHMALGEHSPGEKMMEMIIGSIDESESNRKMTSMHYDNEQSIQNASLSNIDFNNYNK